jgi:cytochrome c biogenesis protein CcdA
MDFGVAAYALGYLAGALSTLSPCVLPLLPILVATATTQHRHGPLALAGGLTLSFAAVGLFIATIGVAIGIDQGVLRVVAAWLLVLFGVAMLVPPLQRGFQRLATWATAGGESGLAHLSSGRGWAGQLVLGLVLGIVWSPCVGPTLGATSTLAAQGRQLPQVALMMLLFGLGAATPLVLVGGASRELLARWRGRLASAGRGGQWVLGVVFITIGIVIFGGADKRIEAWALEHSPEWLTKLTTRF